MSDQDTKIDDGGAVHPHYWEEGRMDGDVYKISPKHHGGISLRAEFAKVAMEGFLAGPPRATNDMGRIADESVRMADALILALKGGG